MQISYKVGLATFSTDKHLQTTLHIDNLAQRFFHCIESNQDYPFCHMSKRVWFEKGTHNVKIFY